MLVQERDPQAGAQQRRDDLAEAVDPLDAAVRRRLGLEVRVGALVLEDERLVVEVRVRDGQLVIGERVGQGMELDEVEASVRREQRADHVRPALDVGQPVERAEAGVDDVEATPAERARRVVDVGVDEVGLETGAACDVACRLDRGRREVQPRDPCALTGPGERVQAEMALQVQERRARDAGQLALLEGAQGRAAGEEPVDVVEVAAHVDRHALVPQRAVRLAPVGHERRRA